MKKVNITAIIISILVFLLGSFKILFNIRISCCEACKNYILIFITVLIFLVLVSLLFLISFYLKFVKAKYYLDCSTEIVHSCENIKTVEFKKNKKVIFKFDVEEFDDIEIK